MPDESEQKEIDRYIELKQQIDKLEDELDGIKENIFKIVDAAEDNKIESDTYTLKSTRRVKYKYSQEYDAKNKELKALKKSEIENKIATEDGFSEYVTLKLK